MKMRHHIQIAGIALAVMAAPLTASAQVNEIEIQPGLYDYTETTSLAGFPQGTDKFKYCIKDGENRWDLMGLFAQNDLDGKCTLSNVQMTSSSGSADTSCRIEEIGLTVTAKIDANFTKTSFDAVMTTNFPNMPASVSKITASRSGVCPADWVNPAFEDEEE